MSPNFLYQEKGYTKVTSQQDFMKRAERLPDSFRPERVLFRPGGVNLRGFLCGVREYASAQPLDFLASTKNASFPIRKLPVTHPGFPDGHQTVFAEKAPRSKCFFEVERRDLRPLNKKPGHDNLLIPGLSGTHVHDRVSKGSVRVHSAEIRT